VSLNAAILYQDVGSRETTNLSVRRGADAPFKIVGLPQSDTQRWAERLRDADMVSLSFVPIDCTPNASNYRGEKCHYAWVFVVDWQRFDVTRPRWEHATLARSLYPQAWGATSFNGLLENDAIYEAVKL